MLVFLHVPKTAGSSFHFVLENNFGAHCCHTNHTKRPAFTPSDLAFARKIFPRLEGIAGHNLVAPMALPIANPFHITFLREPISRVLSQYQERMLINRQLGRPLLDFETALRTDDELENLHVKLMAGERDLDRAKRYLAACDFVGLTEKFDLSLCVLQKLYPRKLNVRYQKRRVQRDDTIKRQFERDSKMIELAREFNKLDLELYRFAANEIFPQMCDRAGFRAGDVVARLDTGVKAARFKIYFSRFYNRVVYRQLCKLRHPFSERAHSASCKTAGQTTFPVSASNGASFPGK